MQTGWHFGFNDNSPAGWLLTAGYLVAAGLCLHHSKKHQWRATLTGRSWLIIGFGMLFLGINKQLDLQDWMRFAGRDLTMSLGLYDHKRWIRLAFLLGIGLPMLAGGVWWGSRHRAFLSTHLMITSGVLVLIGFVVLRATGPAWQDRMHHTAESSTIWNWRFGMESSGLFAVLAGALAEHFRDKGFGLSGEPPLLPPSSPQQTDKEKGIR